MYLKDILNFHALDDGTKQALKAQGKSQRRGAAGVEFGNPAHLMDAAGYIKEAWDAISPATIRNAFHKADLKMILGVESPINDLEVQDIINGFNYLNIDITTADFEATLDLDSDENSEYQSALMEEADKLLKEHEVILEKHEVASTSSSVDGPDIPSTSSQSLSEAPVVNFPSTIPQQSLGHIFQLALEINDDLAADSQAAIDAGPHYDAIKSSFEIFQKALKKGMIHKKRTRPEGTKKRNN